MVEKFVSFCLVFPNNPFILINQKANVFWTSSRECTLDSYFNMLLFILLLFVESNLLECCFCYVSYCTSYYLWLILVLKLMANYLLVLKNHSVLLNYLFLSKEMTFKFLLTSTELYSQAIQQFLIHQWNVKITSEIFFTTALKMLWYSLSLIFID